MKTFSHAIKGAYCAANEEIELFTYDKGPGVITEQWYTGYECLGPKTIIRYYVDNSSTPSIEMNLYMAHGIGFTSKLSGKSHFTETESESESAADEEEGVENFHVNYNEPDDPGRFTIISIKQTFL